ncbi:hypothetical protein AVEN_180082-1 [Araneus ventricosus]|uniref:Uncharacterized protein n=1 Tax=Araneus ventricosus TaxID=182803 RepID=A0A4Y2KGF7_ARAVE|nr:hypothetical protein AVEN_180082-1 [Araneus ventricosus]
MNWTHPTWVVIYPTTPPDITFPSPGSTTCCTILSNIILRILSDIVQYCTISLCYWGQELGNELRLARIIGPPTALISEAISEPHLLSKEENRLNLDFVAVKRKFLDRPEPPRSV